MQNPSHGSPRSAQIFTKVAKQGPLDRFARPINMAEVSRHGTTAEIPMVGSDDLAKESPTTTLGHELLPKRKPKFVPTFPLRRADVPFVLTPEFITALSRDHAETGRVEPYQNHSQTAAKGQDLTLRWRYALGTISQNDMGRGKVVIGRRGLVDLRGVFRVLDMHGMKRVGATKKKEQHRERIRIEFVSRLLEQYPDVSEYQPPDHNSRKPRLSLSCTDC